MLVSDAFESLYVLYAFQGVHFSRGNKGWEVLGDRRRIGWRDEVSQLFWNC